MSDNPFEFTPPLELADKVLTRNGTLQYSTNNLLDEQIMEEFATCISEINPHTLLDHLQKLKSQCKKYR